MNVTVHHEIPLAHVLIILVAGFACVILASALSRIWDYAEEWWLERKLRAQADEILDRVASVPNHRRNPDGHHNGSGPVITGLAERY